MADLNAFSRELNYIYHRRQFHNIEYDAYRYNTIHTGNLTDTSSRP